LELLFGELKTRRLFLSRDDKNKRRFFCWFGKLRKSEFLVEEGGLPRAVPAREKFRKKGREGLDSERKRGAGRITKEQRPQARLGGQE